MKITLDVKIPEDKRREAAEELIASGGIEAMEKELRKSFIGNGKEAAAFQADDIVVKIDAEELKPHIAAILMKLGEGLADGEDVRS